MTAVFILGINMFVAAVFATAFGVVAATIRTSRGLRRADTALYAAKAAGRNRVCSGMEGFDKPVPASNAA